MGHRGRRGKPRSGRARFEVTPEDIAELAYRHGAWPPSTEPGEGSRACGRCEARSPEL